MTLPPRICARASQGYAVDMVIFSAITMVMVVLAGFVFLFSIDWGEQDPTDPAALPLSLDHRPGRAR